MFVGREAELDALRTGLAGAIGGQGGLLLIAGEPGIGKTRLAEQLVGHAIQAGAEVLWGRCWDGGGAPAYWPWIQVIRSSIEQMDDKTVRARLGAGAADVARVVAEVAERLPGLPPPAPLDAEQARFRLFDSVGRFLANTAAACPQVLILDDLHAADVESLLLLTFLARDLRGMRVLVVSAYRDVEATRDPGVDRALTRLAREGDRLHLGGLAEAEVTGLIEDTTGVRAASELVAAVHRTTGGNPLFAAAVVDLLARQGRLEQTGSIGRLEIPREVRGAIRQRLGRLCEQTRRVLAQAAVIGREFDLGLLGRVVDVPPEALEDAVFEALGWAILVESVQTPGRLRFSHDLVRRVLYAEIAPHHRAVLHRKVGMVLEKLYADSLDSPLPQLAHHFIRAAEVGEDDDACKAIDYARKAGDRAIALLAYEDAVAQYAQALRLLERGGESEAARLEVLLELADARMRTGDVASSRQTCRQAIELARRLQAPEQLTRAVLGLAGVLREVWTVDRSAVALLEEALDLVAEGDPGLRAMLLAQLALELYWSEATHQSGPLSLEALQLAGHSGSPVALARSLHARHYALWEPAHLAERLAIAKEHVRVAAQAEDKDMLLMGRHWRIVDLLEQGSIAEVDRELETFDRLAEEVRHPTARWYGLGLRALRAFMAGRFDDAERLAQAAHSTGRRLERKDAFGIYAALMLWPLREQGRLEELEPLLHRATQRYREGLAWPSARANISCRLGRTDTARAEFERLTTGQFARISRNPECLLILALLAETCTLLDDERRASELYDRLIPYANRHATGAWFASLGATSRSLGLLARTMGQHGLARRHFEAALKANRRMGALPWTAHTQHEYAVLLLDHGEPNERPVALGLLSEALDTASSLGMRPLEDAVSARLAILEPRQTPAAEPMKAAPMTANVFRRQGEYWAIAYGGPPFLLEDMKGLGYIARLLAEPDREFHALDLVRMEQARLDDAGHVLDHPAKAAYRRRLTELRHELDEAIDTEHASRLQTEIDSLALRLATAVGLGDRDRKATPAAERGRLNVTQRIRAAIRKITGHDPHLGRHLEISVRTGTFCSYRPDPAARVPWTI